MPHIWKVLLSFAVDAVATVFFFYAGLLAAPYAAGFTGAGIAYVSSLIPGFGHGLWPAGESFFSTALLYSLAALYALLVFAIGIEVLRRLIGSKSPWLYVAGAVAVIATYIRPGGAHVEWTAADVALIANLLFAGAIGGIVYWLVTIRFRAFLTLLARRLLCGAAPQENACPVF